MVVQCRQRAGIEKFVRQCDLVEGVLCRAFSHEGRGNRLAQSAHDRVVLRNNDWPTGAPTFADDRFGIERLDCRNMKNATGNALLLENLGSLEHTHRHQAA